MNTQQQSPVRVILFLTFVLTLSVGARSGSAQLGVSRNQIDGEPAESNRSPADSWPPNAELLTIHNAELNTTADMILLDNTIVGMLFPNAKRYDINSFLRFALADQPQPEDKKKFWISKPWLASVSPPVGQTRPEAVSQNTGIIGAYRYVTFGSNGAVSASPWTREYSTRTVGTIKHQFGWYEYAYESFDGRYILHFNGM